MDDKSFLDVDATRGVDELPPTFFNDMQPDVHCSAKGDAHPHSSASALLGRLSSLLHRSRPDGEATKPSQLPRPSGLHSHVLIARLSSLVHRSPPDDDAAKELQQPSTPSGLGPHALLGRLSSLLPHSRFNTDSATEPQHPPTPLGSRPGVHIGRCLSSLFRSPPATIEKIEPLMCPMQTTPSRRSPHVVEVAAMRDKQALYVAPRPERDRSRTTWSAGTAVTTAQSGPLSLWAHLVLFLCCASPRQAEQTQDQPQGQVQAQASLQAQPAAASTSTTRTPTAIDTSATAPGAESAQSRVPLRARFVLSLCCVSPLHDDGH
ncbi:hypothetical protein EDB19DRAFT_380440 [Suillus lakei]|nr:hypothetical protein EDB19DRAFT_380440 [Suillus lakei]